MWAWKTQPLHWCSSARLNHWLGWVTETKHSSPLLCHISTGLIKGKPTNQNSPGLLFSWRTASLLFAFLCNYCVHPMQMQCSLCILAPVSTTGRVPKKGNYPVSAFRVGSWPGLSAWGDRFAYGKVSSVASSMFSSFSVKIKNLFFCQGDEVQIAFCV